MINQWTELLNMCSLGCLLTNFAHQQQKKVTVGQIKFYDGPGAGLGAELRCRTWCQTKNYEILKFGNLTVFKVFSDMDGVNVKFG